MTQWKKWVHLINILIKFKINLIIYYSRGFFAFFPCTHTTDMCVLQKEARRPNHQIGRVLKMRVRRGSTVHPILVFF